MKAHHSSWLAAWAAALAGLTLVQCSQEVGSLSSTAIHSALRSRSLSLSQSSTAWLQAADDTISISAADKKRIIDCVRNGSLKINHDGYYEDLDDEVDRDARVYYLSPSNGQTMVVRIKEGKAELDDIELPQASQAQLYSILAPYLSRFSAPTP